jgi:ADP-heptose:LPS heptosyltransferase
LDGIIPYPGKFKGLRRLIRDLRSFRPDLAVIVHANDPDILPLCWLSGAGTIIGPAVSRFSFLVDVVVPPADPRTPYVERYLAGVRAAAGFPVPAGPEILFLPKERTDWADEFWAREGLGTGEPLVVMNPGGSHESKRWPDDYWRELIRLLGQADGPRLALFGSNAERPLLEDLARTAIHKTAWVVTRPQVVDAAALLTRASVLVGPDSGLAHMAYGLGVPAVIFFGPDDPALSGPYQPRGPAMVLVRDKSVCPQVPGCRKKVCRPNRCLLAITPDEVTRAVRKYL